MKRRFLRMPIFIVLSFGLNSLGCRKQGDTHVEYKKAAVERTSKNFVIPRELRDEIEKLYLEFIRKENPKVVLNDEEVLDRIPREFLNVEVLLHGSSPGVLADNTQFMLSRGGGEIDLKEYVLGAKGSFFLKFKINRTDEPDVEIHEPKVFFLSEAKKRKIAKESFGSGCKKYMDISSFIVKSNSQEGIHLNATEQRYLSVIGGIFYFVNFSPERKIYLAAVRIVDSRYPELLCE